MPRSPRRDAASLILCGLGLAALAGCQEEGVHAYKAPAHETFAPYRYTPLRYTAPDDWEEVGDLTLSGPAPPAARFHVAKGGLSAEVTVTPIAGPAGGELANVNRWLHLQLHQPELKDEAELEKIRKPIEVGGIQGFYVNLLGPDGPDQERILGAVVRRGNETWFFKMKGPARLVADGEGDFKDRFLKSVRFETGDAGDQGGRS
jgi:hypothetical protein